MMRNLSMSGLALGFLTTVAAAQSSDLNLQPQSQPTISPAQHSPFTGVPAKAPSINLPMGIPAQQPSPGRIVPIVPQLPPSHSPQVISPTPPPTSGADNTRSDLIRRFVATRGDGVTYVNGWPYAGQPVAPTDGAGPWSPSSGFGSQSSFPVSTSGGHIRGYYNGNDWRLAFHVGTGSPLINYRTDTSLFKYPVRMYRSYYAPWEDAYRYGNDPYGYNNSYLIVGSNEAYLTSPQVAPRTPAQPPIEPTSLEKAEYSLRVGEGAEAVRQFKLHLKESPDDAGVERLMAMALIDDRKVDQAVAVLIHAYTKQPQLARDPVDPRMLAGSEMDHRRRFTAIMDFANRTKTGSAFFAASVLAQSEGRYDTAQKLLDRSLAIGLDKKVAEEMKIALANR